MRLILNILYFLTDDVLEVRYKEGGTYQAPGLETRWLTENTAHGTHHTVLLKPELSARIGKVTFSLSQEFQDTDRVFVNGYQSWTESREFTPGESIPKLKGPGRALMERAGDYTFFNYSGRKGVFHGFTWSYLRNKEDDFLLLGSVDESTGYTIYTWDLPAHELVIRKGIDNLVIDGTYKVMDLYVGQSKEEEVFGDWFKIQELPRIQARPLAGWTSWYYHYTRISAEIVEANLKAFSSRQIPLDLIQIDDGWQPAVGDWLESNDKFPLGMKALVDSIHSHGYQAGLWLAPFIVERNSGIFKEHRDWLLTYDGEHLVKGGFNPLWGGVLNGYFYILDLRKTEVRKYLTTVMDQVLNQWGFDLVKLDFLYAIALIPLSNKSRGQIMSEAMDFLREICGEKLILGCGVPLGPSFGKVDYCRIGCDTHLNWELNIMRKAGLRERISTFTTLRDTIGRRQLNQHAFLNDPDVYILRNEKTKLSEEQKLTLFYVNQIFGSMVLTSDDITTYDEATLALYRLQFPVKFRKITRVEEAGLLKKVWFEMEDRKYFAAINLGDETVSVSLEEGLWYERTLGFISGAKEIQLPPYATRCWYLCGKKPLSVFASTAHLFPGAEIKSLVREEGGIKLDLEEKNSGLGEIFLLLETGQTSVRINGKKVEAENLEGKTVARISLQQN